MNNEPFVSIVTPVYNGERYIRECIESVLSQNYTNWEYIILNNKSQDGTLEIAREYAAKNKRIRVVDNDEFLPVIGNFNNAVKNISDKSKYCKFVCADDWLFPDCISKMVALAEANPKVGIVGSYRLVESLVVPEGIPYSRNVFSGQEMARMNLLDGPYTFGAPSAIMYRAEIMQNRKPFFNESHTAADTEACYETLKDWGFGFVHQVLSFNRIHKNSVTSTGMVLNTNMPNHFSILRKYGPIFLENDEYEKKVRKVTKEYYRFLAGKPTNLLNKKFLNYHKNSMNDNGLSFRWLMVLNGWLFLFGRRMIDTKQNLKSLITYFNNINNTK